MLGNRFRRIVARIFGGLSLVALLCAGGGPSHAQSLVSGNFNSSTGTVTATDSSGNTFNISLAGLSAGGGTLTGTFGGQPITLTVKSLGGSLFAVTVTLPDNQLFTCTVNIATFSGTCSLANTPRSTVASISGGVRSQSSAAVDLVTDRVRAVAGSLAQGGAASAPTPPGGTVILNNFSSTQPSKYDGRSAGSADMRWGLWANASGSFLNNDSTAFGYDGTSVVALTGLDYVVDRQWILGLTAGYTHADLSLSPSTVTRTADGALVGPYASYIINSNFAIDGLVNYTSLSNNVGAPAGLPSGSYHSDRVTAATDLDFFTSYEAVKLTGYGGYAYSWEGGNTAPVLGSSAANNVRYGAIRLGAEAAYPLGAFEPYVPLTFEYETTNPADGTSRAALIVGAGMRYRWSDSLTGGLLFESTEFKTHTRDYLVGANLRWSF